MNVKLITYTPDPERMVARAARVCYAATDLNGIDDELTDERIGELVRRMIATGHGSTIEHVSFTFGVEGVSRSLTHQLVRHRIASYDQQSQRYVSMADAEYVTPPTITGDAVEVYAEAMSHATEAYRRLTELGVPKEDARYVLPNATETRIIVTMNARSLLHFLRLRCCSRAQWEIRRLAEAMLTEVRKVAPRLFANAGPTCVIDGVCHEARPCGRLAAMRKEASS